jgi:D-xylose 1-dehydrogenase (NADP+, D-xylono-1,5-lactone-forming)
VSIQRAISRLSCGFAIRRKLAACPQVKYHAAMNDKIGWGILGCARIARKALIPGILASANSRLVALASRDQHVARRWATEFGIPKAYGSYAELLADPEVDAVYIPLPNELHKVWTVYAAEAGKHVLCDKPLARDAAEAEEMVACCRQRGVRLMEGFMWRHQPRTGQVLAMIGRGDIGQLRLVRCSFSFDIDRTDWRLDSSRGGGALRDIGCYGVNTCRLFCDAEPTAVHATAHHGPTGVDMTLAAILQFPGDVLGQIDCSFEVPYRCHYEIVGTEGTIEAPRAYQPSESPIILLRRGDTCETVPAIPGNQYTRMVDHFNNAIRFGRPIDKPAEDGLANIRVLDAIAAAAKCK